MFLSFLYVRLPAGPLPVTPPESRRDRTKKTSPTETIGSIVAGGGEGKIEIRFTSVPSRRKLSPIEVRASKVQGRMPFSTDNWAGYETRRVQIAASLWCLMIVASSLDRLPDPPALKPQGKRNHLVVPLEHLVPVAAKNPTAKNYPSHCLPCVPHLRASVFSVGRIFESSGSAYKRSFVRQATDASPPCFS